MNVDELQMHLSDLAQLLRNAAGKKAADGLADFCQRLQPYRDRRVQEVMDLLDKAEEIVRTGTPPERKSTRKPKSDPQLAEQLCNRVVNLYQRAKEPETTRELIESTFTDLEKLELSVGQLQELAKKLDISQKIRAKKALIDTIKRAVLDRRGAFQRVQV